MTAQDVLDSSAALLNDQAKQIFTDAVMLPYLKIAYDELQEELELNAIPVTNVKSAAIVVTAGVLGIGDTGQPALPTDLISPISLYERSSGTNDSYTEMTHVEFLPNITTLIDVLGYWAWMGQFIKFIGANTDRDVKIEYTGMVLTPIASVSTVISLYNAKTFLEYRTAALGAQFIGENKERSDDLNVFARLGMDRLLGINVKGEQSIVTRRRPFMASYKSRGVF